MSYTLENSPNNSHNKQAERCKDYVVYLIANTKTSNGPSIEKCVQRKINLTLKEEDCSSFNYIITGNV